MLLFLIGKTCLLSLRALPRNGIGDSLIGYIDLLAEAINALERLIHVEACQMD